MQFYPYGSQWIDDADVEAVAETLRSDYLTTGPKVDEFEAAIAERATCGHAIAVNSGTSALHVAYFAAGLQEGDEIITSPLTFAATSNAALYLGAKPVFVDIDPRTGNIDPQAVEAAITSRTKLIVPVDYAGQPADYDSLQAIADEHKLKIVADAAHSYGATYKGRPVGTLADATEISMHPVKPFTTGEGGAVLTSDDELAALASRFRTHGITRDRSEMTDDHGPWYYEQIELGFNYRMTDVQAALGVSQLKRLGGFLSRRNEIAEFYHDAFADIDELELPHVEDDVVSGWHLYVVKVRDAQRRRAFFERLRELSLGVQVHYLPVYQHPYYQGLDMEFTPCPNADDFYARCVSLPMFPRLDDDGLAQVAERVRQAVSDVLRD